MRQIFGLCGLCGGEVLETKVHIREYLVSYDQRTLQCTECGATAQLPILLMRDRRKKDREFSVNKT